MLAVNADGNMRMMVITISLRTTAMAILSMTTIKIKTC